MTTRKKPVPKAEGAKAARPDPVREKPEAAALAAMVLRPSANAAAVVSAYAGPFGVNEGDDIGALMDRLGDDVKDLWAGDMKRAEAMLYGQAHALQAIFMNLARRAAKQEYLKQWEAYLRMALKAQNQCRMTLETLATVKNPSVVFARQANIAHGPQQVNNGPPDPTLRAPAANALAAPTGLLEQQHGEWLDPGAAGAAGGADPDLAPMGEVNRAEKR